MNLVKLALAVEQFAQDRPPVTVDPARCLRSRNKAATCESCISVCPVGAIRLENGPHVDGNLCVACGLCVRECPAGALDGQDETPRLLNCVTHLVERESVEIACAVHPNPASGDPAISSVIQTGGCLATFGPSAYLGLALSGVQRTLVRLDCCAQCPLARAKSEIESAVKEANDVLAVLGRAETVAVTAPVKRPKSREVVSVKNPPVSRRGFFKALTRPNAELADRILGPEVTPQRGEKYSPRERRHFINALRELASSNHADETAHQTLAGAGFARLSATDACSACELCARVCPTGALDLLRNDGSFQLTFATSACTDCGICLRFCDTGALKRDGLPTIAALLAPERLMLQTGALTRCRRCNALFAAKSDTDLCPVCTFRRSGVQTFSPLSSKN